MTQRKLNWSAGIVSLPCVFQNVGAIQPDLAENFARVQPLVGGEQNQIAFLDFQFEVSAAFPRR
jgi:hypothetical protein